jgi:hypothetical protein
MDHQESRLTVTLGIISGNTAFQNPIRTIETALKERERFDTYFGEPKVLTARGNFISFQTPVGGIFNLTFQKIDNKKILVGRIDRTKILDRHPSSPTYADVSLTCN